MMWVKRFIGRIQNSDEQIKRRWTILFSVTAIMVVTAFWILFMVRQISFVAPEITNIDEPGFWQIFKNGALMIFNSIGENIKNIFLLITEKNTIVIE